MALDDSVSDVDETTIEASNKVTNLVGKDRLRRLKVRKNWPGLLFLSGHFGLLVISGYLLWQSLGTPWIYTAVFVHGVIIAHLFAPWHECCHSTAFRSRWLTQSVYWICGLILTLPPLAFRYQHADHHTYTQDIERDPQMIAIGEKLGGFFFYATTIPYFVDILRKLSCYAIGRFNETDRRVIPHDKLPAVQREAWIYIGVYMIIAAVSVWHQSLAALIYWFIPRVIGEVVERMIRMSEHVGCAHSPDMLKNTRTVYAWAPFRWLSWNMPLHTAHHAVPLVPFHAIPELNTILHEQLKEVRYGYVASIAAMVRNALRGGLVANGRDRTW